MNHNTTTTTTNKPIQLFTPGQLVVWLQAQWAKGGHSNIQGIDAIVMKMVGRDKVEITLSLPNGQSSNPIIVPTETLRMICHHCGFYPANPDSAKCKLCETLSQITATTTHINADCPCHGILDLGGGNCDCDCHEGEPELCWHCKLFAAVPNNSRCEQCEQCECEQCKSLGLGKYQYQSKKQKDQSITTTTNPNHLTLNNLQLRFAGYIERSEGCPACNCIEREVYAANDDIEYICARVRVRFLREVLPKSQNSDSLPRNQILT
jgi:hypothetical protein